MKEKKEHLRKKIRNIFAKKKGEKMNPKRSSRIWQTARVIGEKTRLLGTNVLRCVYLPAWSQRVTAFYSRFHQPASQIQQPTRECVFTRDASRLLHNANHSYSEANKSQVI